MADEQTPTEPAPETAPEPPPTSATTTTTTTSEATPGRAIWMTGVAVVLIGVIAMVVSIFLDWQDVDGATAAATDVPAEFLIDNDTLDGDPSLAVPLGIAAALAAIGALLRPARLIGLLGGLLGVAVVALYCLQVNSRLDDLPGEPGLFDFIGIGAYAAAAGAIVVLVGSLLPRGASG